MKKILYISYDGMTDPLGQSQVLPYLAGLSAKGHEIHLVSFEKKDRYEEMRNDILTFCNSNKISWYPEWYTAKPAIFSTLKDIRNANKRVAHLMNQHSFEIIHCRSYISGLIGLKWKRKSKCKFIFDMRGFWADERIDGGIWNVKNPIFKLVYRYFKGKEKEMLMHADAVVSLTNRAKEEMISWNVTPNLGESIYVIPCCADLNLFAAKGQTFNGYKPFILGYIGSTGTWYKLDEMLDFFKVLKQYQPDAQFHFATKDQPEQIINRAAAKGILKEDVKVQSLKHAEVPLFIETLNASVLFIVPSYSKMASCPTKLGELMAMGIPSYANAGVGDTEEIIRKYKAGAVVESFDEKGYKKAIEEMKAADLDQTKIGANEVFSLEKGVESYHSIYQSLN